VGEKKTMMTCPSGKEEKVVMKIKTKSRKGKIRKTKGKTTPRVGGV